MEIERKFLPENRNELLALIKDKKSKQFSQGYLNISPVIRIRKEDEDYFLTYKGYGMMAREEYNLPINKETFQHLFPKCDNQIITKTRYYYELSSHRHLIAEIDVFHGVLEGLILIEVEFPNEQTANQFTPPSWFGKDVTFDSNYHNSSLSTRPSLKDIK